MEIDLVFNAKGGGRWDEEKPVENKPVENKPVESGGDYSTNSSIRSRDYDLTIPGLIYYYTWINYD